MNNKYKIIATHPLVRPGLTIETEASERYMVSVAKKLMDLIRELNESGCKCPEEKHTHPHDR